MTLSYGFIAALSCVAVACSFDPTTNTQYSNSVRLPTMSEIDAYLLDLSDAAAINDDVVADQVDGTVAEDLGGTRLNEMAIRMLEVADIDNSGTLSLDELLDVPGKLGQHHEGDVKFTPSVDQQEIMKVHLTADFERFSGNDSLHNQEEIIALLIENAPRVAHHRGRGHGHHFPYDREDMDREHQHRGRHRLGFGHGPTGDIIEVYDKDDDGKLNQEELEAFMAVHRPGHRDVLPRNNVGATTP